VFGAKGGGGHLQGHRRRAHGRRDVPREHPYEMVTVYHLDGKKLVLTHYCSGGTQPRVRSKGLKGNVLAFDVRHSKVSWTVRTWAS
jgi:hypothetical protein